MEATLSALYRASPLAVAGTPAFAAELRGQGGWFGASGRAPARPRDETVLSRADFDELVAAFRSTGFSGADAWYMNDAANLAYAAEAPDFGRLTLPALFLHAEHDVVCDTVRSRLAEPMREDCADLTEITIDGGHMLMLERPEAVNRAIAAWCAGRLDAATATGTTPLAGPGATSGV